LTGITDDVTIHAGTFKCVEPPSIGRHWLVRTECLLGRLAKPKVSPQPLALEIVPHKGYTPADVSTNPPTQKMKMVVIIADTLEDHL
jgi:hypothetical protein